MRLTKIFAALLLVFFLISSLAIRPLVLAETPEEKLNRLRQEITQYEEEIGRLGSKANTLKNQIAQYDAQIRLTTLKIAQTEERIALLGGRIDELEVSLRALTAAFSSRASETYKMARLGDPFLLLISSSDLASAVSRFHYLQRIQVADRELLIRLQRAQTTYKGEKVDQEELQSELEVQKGALASQKAAKAKLLEITRNDERRYQQLLTRARAEFEAIQSIIAGKGEETEVGPVGEAVRIASIIPSSSSCSTGGHLHFEVAKDEAHQNPANFLIPKNFYDPPPGQSCPSGVNCWDNSPDGPFGFGGSWQWPINNPIRITQGYGMTYYASTLRYYGGSGHTGIDMVNDNDYTVKAARPGILFRGAIACGGGTLRYVHVKQDDGYDAYYLHVNY